MLWQLLQLVHDEELVQDRESRMSDLTMPCRPNVLLRRLVVLSSPFSELLPLHPHPALQPLQLQHPRRHGVVVVPVRRVGRLVASQLVVHRVALRGLEEGLPLY